MCPTTESLVELLLYGVQKLERQRPIKAIIYYKEKINFQLKTTTFHHKDMVGGILYSVYGSKYLNNEQKSLPTCYTKNDDVVPRDVVKEVI